MKKITAILVLVGSGYLAGCSSTQDDPLEGYNRTMYSINKTVDKYTLKPITKGYRAITPDRLREGLITFLATLVM